MAQDLGQQAKEKIVKQKIVGQVLSGNQTGNQTGRVLGQPGEQAKSLLYGQ